MADPNDIKTRLNAREKTLTELAADAKKINKNGGNGDKTLDGTELMQFALDEYQAQHKGEKNVLERVLENIATVKKQWKENAPKGSDAYTKAENAKATLYEIIRDIPSRIVDRFKEVPDIISATAQLGEEREREQQAAAKKAAEQTNQRQATADKARSTVQTRVDALGELSRQIESDQLPPAQIREAANKIMNTRNLKGPSGYTRQGEHKDGPSFDELLTQAETKGMTPDIKKALLGQLAGLQRNISQAGQLGAESIANAPIPARDTPAVDPKQVEQEQKIMNLGKTLLELKVDPSINPANMDMFEQTVKTAIAQQNKRNR